jgi:heat shock protein HtpX
MLNVYDQINSNKRKSFLIVAGFGVFISVIGYVFGYVRGGPESAFGALVFALGFSGISGFTSYFFSDKIVLSIAGAKKIDQESNPRIYGIVENLCVGAGIRKVPALYIIDDSAPNAFATGRNPDNAAIAMTQGLLDKLDKREIEGVLAHELSHIRNYDILLMAIVAVLVGSVTMIANMMFHGSFNSDSDGERRKVPVLILAIGLILALLSPIIAELIKLGVSRRREFLADASAALLTRDPEGLASALEKIASDQEPLEVANEATAHLYFSNPLKKGVNADFWAGLFNTHPPVSERIKLLREM